MTNVANSITRATYLPGIKERLVLTSRLTSPSLHHPKYHFIESLSFISLPKLSYPFIAKMVSFSFVAVIGLAAHVSSLPHPTLNPQRSHRNLANDIPSPRFLLSAPLFPDTVSHQ